MTTRERLPARVYIVGAGPGDPDLITVRGQSLLQQADTIVFTNSLIPEQMLRSIRLDAEVIPTADKTLEAIVAVLVDRVRRGRSVVRLHDGDPCFYSTAQEQMNALLAAGIPFEIVPGISTYQLAAARLRVELTLPAQVQSILLTRIGGRTEVPAAEDLATMAAHRASLCLYLSARHVEAAQARLLEHYPADTPVAICYHLGWEDEKLRLVPLAQMAAATQAEHLVRSTTFIISPALSAATVPPEYGQVACSPLASSSQLYSGTYGHLFRPVDDSP